MLSIAYGKKICGAAISPLGHVQFYLSSRAVLIRSYMLFKIDIETYTDYTHTIIFSEGSMLVSDRGQAFFCVDILRIT